MISIRLHDLQDLEVSVRGSEFEGTYDAAKAKSPRIAERLVARHALSAHLSARGATVGSVDPGDFQTTVLGAPFLAKSSHHMGIAHTGRHIATVVYDKSVVVGIDIELIARELGTTGDADIEALSAGVLSQGLPLPPVALFCAREAAGKALGIGLLANWSVYQPSGIQDVSESCIPLWRISYASLPFLTCYVVIVDSILVLACAVAKSAEEYTVRNAIAELELVRLKS